MQVQFVRLHASDNLFQFLLELFFLEGGGCIQSVVRVLGTGERCVLEGIAEIALLLCLRF